MQKYCVPSVRVPMRNLGFRPFLRDIDFPLFRRVAQIGGANPLRIRTRDWVHANVAFRLVWRLPDIANSLDGFLHDYDFTGGRDGNGTKALSGCRAWLSNPLARCRFNS